MLSREVMIVLGVLAFMVIGLICFGKNQASRNVKVFLIGSRENRE